MDKIKIVENKIEITSPQPDKVQAFNLDEVQGILDALNAQLADLDAEKVKVQAGIDYWSRVLTQANDAGLVAEVVALADEAVLS